MTNSIQLAIEALILKRSATLKLGRSDLVRRAGFKNVSKGLRRLDQLCAGEFKSTASLIAGLPAALELPRELVADAVRQTEQQVAEARRITEQEEEAAWRAKFQPCAYFVGTTIPPSSICMYGISGGSDRWLKIPLDLSQPPVTFAAQALTVVRRSPFVQFFGATTGFIVNYTPYYAVRFDLSGFPVEMLDHAFRPGEVTLTLGRKTFPAQNFFNIEGNRAVE